MSVDYIERMKFRTLFRSSTKKDQSTVFVIPDNVNVIDWDSALEQCSGDKLFVQELLVDLLGEARSHVNSIKKSLERGDMLGVQHAAHSIKGAAANLMCHRLRIVALYMETEGKTGTQLESGSSKLISLKSCLYEAFKVLEQEVVSLEKVIDSFLS